jgi:hypothetical protein
MSDKNTNITVKIGQSNHLYAILGKWYVMQQVFCNADGRIYV